MASGTSPYERQRAQPAPGGMQWRARVRTCEHSSHGHPIHRRLVIHPSRTTRVTFVAWPPRTIERQFVATTSCSRAPQLLATRMRWHLFCVRRGRHVLRPPSARLRPAATTGPNVSLARWHGALQPLPRSARKEPIFKQPYTPRFSIAQRWAAQPCREGK